MPEKEKICFTHSVQFSSVQLLSHVPLFVTPWTTARQDLQSSWLKESMDRGAWLQSMRLQRVGHNWVANCVQLFATPWTTVCHVHLSFTISQRMIRIMSTESVMLSNHFIFCGSLLLLPSILPSIKVFPSELSLHINWPMYWSFSFSICLSNEYSGLISFRIDWFELTGLMFL